MVFADMGEIISGGNFHGEYPAKAMDYLAIGVHELCNMSERRIERLVNPSLSELPAFLTPEGGLNSGFMIAHCTAAALVLAIELLAACQALEFLRPLKTTAPLEEVYRIVRSVVRPWTKDRYMAPDIDAVTKLLQDGKIWQKVKPMIDHYHSVQIIETRVFSPTTTSRPAANGPTAPKRRRMGRTSSFSKKD
nr:hypothetical protein BaRGS_002011 [Batillaria attramentaria]